MRFHHLDLNLLVALDVLLEEQNITRAAERLHMTQSATSGVLGRLRTFFEDELLVQVGRKMQPTPYALELAQPVREVLLTIRSSITAKPVFDPSSSKRHLRLVTSDYLISVLFAQVIQKIHLQAPHITFEMISPGDNSAELLMRGEVDMMIVPERYLIDGHPSQLLFEEDHVCVVWRDNPQARRVSKSRFKRQPGVKAPPDSLPSSASSLRHIEAAAATETCWPTMVRSMVTNPRSRRRGSG